MKVRRPKTGLPSFPSRPRNLFPREPRDHLQQRRERRYCQVIFGDPELPDLGSKIRTVFSCHIPWVPFNSDREEPDLQGSLIYKATVVPAGMSIVSCVFVGLKGGVVFARIQPPVSLTGFSPAWFQCERPADRSRSQIPDLRS